MSDCRTDLLPNGLVGMVLYSERNHMLKEKSAYNQSPLNEDESISLSSSKSYMRGEIGYVTEVNLIRNNRNTSLLVCLSEYLSNCKK